MLYLPHHRTIYGHSRCIHPRTSPSTCECPQRRHQDAMILQWIFHKLQTIISISTDSATDTFARQLENPYRSPSLYRTQKMCHLPPRLQAATGSAPPVTGCTTLDQTKQHWNPSGTNWKTEHSHWRHREPYPKQDTWDFPSSIKGKEWLRMGVASPPVNDFFFQCV